MSMIASQITSVSIVYSTLCSGPDQRKHQSSVSLAFVGEIHQWLVNSLHKGPVTWKMFPFDDVIMLSAIHSNLSWINQLVRAIFFPYTVYPKKYAHGFCFAVLCRGYTLTDFPISIRLTSLALWQSNDCPSASKANLMKMAKYYMWIHYERLRNHNKAKHNKTVCIFLGIYCIYFSIATGLAGGDR